MTDHIVLEARIEQAASAERLKSQNGDTYLSVDFLDGIERAARIAVSMLTPRIITTVDELDSLPVGSVVRESDTEEAWFKASDAWLQPGRDWAYDTNCIGLPATVLHVPEEQS